MSAYPSLSVKPDAQGFEEGPALDDPTYRSPKDSGRVKTYPKVSWVPIRFAFQYTQLANADKVLLWTFERDTVHYGADPFTWTHPQTSTGYTVRFLTPIQFRREDDQGLTWSVRVELETSQP